MKKEKRRRLKAKKERNLTKKTALLRQNVKYEQCRNIIKQKKKFNEGGFKK